MSDTITQWQINLRARYFYGACLFLFTIRFASSTLFSQLSQPVLISPDIDNTYWIMHWLGIPHLTTHSAILASLLDISLFFLPIIASILPGRRIYAIAYTILIFIYQITISTYSIHHYHGLIGVLFLSIPFWFGQGERFVILWQAVRYYIFFIFSSAAVWKLLNGGLWDSHQMQHILMAQHAQYIYDSPASLTSQIASYLISQPLVSQAILIAGFVLQASFIGGFFTRRLDRIYLILFINFFVVNYLVMHIFSVELLILCLVLLDWEKIEQKEIERASRNA
jgi:hypothetical protein